MKRSAFDPAVALATSTSRWRGDILAALRDYARIPNKSPSFDKDWVANGHMRAAANRLIAWVGGQQIPGMTVRMNEIDGVPPAIFIQIPGTTPNLGRTLMYGHYDKQPEFTGWRSGLSPWEPVLDGDRLYARGVADDGYAIFAAVTAIKLLQEQGVPHGDISILIEGAEESGSPGLVEHLEALQAEIGIPDTIVCLDSGAGDYRRLWLTTSLRGLVMGNLRVDILTEGVHSGKASGIVPSSFNIVRQLLDRVSDPVTGEVALREFRAQVPLEREREAGLAAEAMGRAVFEDFPFVAGAKPIYTVPESAIIAGTWRSALSIVAADGFSTLDQASNTLRPFTALALSARLPPTVNADKAAEALKRALELNPPNGARVTFEVKKASQGWNAPNMQDFMVEIVNDASRAAFGNDMLAFGEGGTIPFMAMLGEKFPHAQFVITGVLGPQSNAHGPNEFLDLPMAERLTVAVAQIMAEVVVEL